MSQDSGEPDGEVIETRASSSAPRINVSSPGTQEDASSWYETDGVNRVTDYGFQAWVRNHPGNSSGLGSQHSNSATISQSELSMRLRSAMVDASRNPAEQWLPLGQLESICQRDVVHSVFLHTLGESFPNIEHYTNYVCGNEANSTRNENTSCKIFAILVLMGQLSKMQQFIEAGIRDQHLPCKKFSSNGMEAIFTLVKGTTSSISDSKSNFYFDNWEQVDKQEFYKHQWSFVVPYFSSALEGTVSLYELDEPCIMPWMNKGEGKTNGGFAEVTKFYMHSDHHAFDTDKVATKKLKAENYCDNPALFRREFSNLKRVKDKVHLLPLYAAYRHGEEYSFIIPWADGGSLKDLCALDPLDLLNKVGPEQDSDSRRARKVISWIAGQLRGLTGESGLGFLHDTKGLVSSRPGLVIPEENHKRYGIHGDIKPANILYFEQENEDGSGLGLFKISDFGITGFHSALTKTRVTGTASPHSPTYRSPEFGTWERGAPEQDTSHAYLSRKYDIWSLGCVLLEFMTWLICGSHGLKEFKEARMELNDQGFREDNFFLVTNDRKPVHKQSVHSQISKLQSAVTEGRYLHDCLELIRNRMLELDVANRADCKEVHEALAAYHRRCLQDDNYAVDLLRTFQEPQTSGSSILRPPASEIHPRSRSPSNLSTTKQNPAINQDDTKRIEQADAERTEEKQKTSKFKKLLSHLRIPRLKSGSGGKKHLRNLIAKIRNATSFTSGKSDEVEVARTQNPSLQNNIMREDRSQLREPCPRASPTDQNEA